MPSRQLPVLRAETPHSTAGLATSMHARELLLAWRFAYWANLPSTHLPALVVPCPRGSLYRYLATFTAMGTWGISVNLASRASECHLAFIVVPNRRQSIRLTIFNQLLLPMSENPS